jgi:Zn-dependent protease with chaperone function
MTDAPASEEGPEQAPSFLLRAVLAIGFAWSFRAMVILFVLAFVVAPFAAPTDSALIIRVVLHVVTVAVGVYALRALVFIRETFRPPAPPLAPDEHRALHELIAEVADALETERPSRVYLLPDVNAFVREPVRWLGLRRDRFVYIGVGLISVSTVSEMRATIAHELAHFVGGDTKLALMLARTRQGLTNLLLEVQGGPLFYPFAVYGAVFFALSQQISRAQELWADRAAVRIAGRRAQSEGLRRSAVGDVLLRRILTRGVPMLLLAGRRPRDAYRFLRAAESGGEREDLRREVQDLLDEQPAEMFDSHPSLSDRIAYSNTVREPEGVSVDDRPARELLDDPEAVERAFTEHLLATTAASSLPLVEDDADALAAIEAWLRTTGEEGRRRAVEWFGQEAGRDVGSALRTLLEVAARSRPAPDDAGATSREAAMNAVLRESLVAPVGALLALVLVDAGGTLELDLIDEVLVARDGEHTSPFERARSALEEPEEAVALLEELSALPATA